MVLSYRFLTLLIANSLLAQPAFFRQDIPVGLGPGFAVAGDFNGDGRNDLAVSLVDSTVYAGSEFAVLLNEGGGRFSFPIRTAKHHATSAWAADFNGDGLEDLVTGDSHLHLSQGDGTFLDPLPVGDERLFPALCIGDFDDDGNPDVAARANGYGIRIWQGNGDGTFHSGAGFAVQNASWAVATDFNQDERTDLITFGTSSTEFGFLVFLGRGDGTFDPEIPIAPTAGPGPGSSLLWPPGASLVADFNGDGMPDIASWGGIMLGKGDGTFESSLPYPHFDAKALPPIPLAAADLTGDGRADLAVHYWKANFISILAGEADGTLSEATHELVGWGNTTMSFWLPADLDGDSRLDLVHANAYSGNVTVLLSNEQESPNLPKAVSTASDSAIVAPGSLATLVAPTGAAGTASASPPWPTTLGGVSLEVLDSAGVAQFAPLVFVSEGQVNFQVPEGTVVGEATLTMIGDAGSRIVGSMQVESVAPGLFMVAPWSAVPAATAVLVESDGSQIPVPVYRCFPSPAGTDCQQSAIPLAAAAGRPLYLTFYGTGFRDASSANVSCMIDNVAAAVAYAGPQGSMPGLDQINIRVPPEVLEEAFFGGSHVVIQIGGVAANVALLRWEEWVD